eukprot:scpid20499/ scgid8437/ 
MQVWLALQTCSTDWVPVTFISPRHAETHLACCTVARRCNSLLLPLLLSINVALMRMTSRKRSDAEPNSATPLSEHRLVGRMADSKRSDTNVRLPEAGRQRRKISLSPHNEEVCVNTTKKTTFREYRRQTFVKADRRARSAASVLNQHAAEIF